MNALCPSGWMRRPCAPTFRYAYRRFESTDASVASNGDLEFELGPVGLRPRASHDETTASTALSALMGLIWRLRDSLSVYAAMRVRVSTVLRSTKLARVSRGPSR